MKPQSLWNDINVKGNEQNKCPKCQCEMVQADYLETEDGFTSALVCMNEDCTE
jgi:hypothetical protein